jgi:hypothetical protein
MRQLEAKLNTFGKRGLTMKELLSTGVKVLAATSPVNSFIGMFQGVKVYAYHDYPTNTWHVERA